MRLQGKVAFITGAASGMGRACSIRFAKEGAKIIACDINDEGLAQTEKQVKEAGGEILALHLDVTKEEQWQSVAKKAAERFGKINILFNSAGILISKPLVETTLEEWNRLMAINVTGTFLGMKHIIPLIEKSSSSKEFGSVINVSSDAGLMGYVDYVLYGASKGAVLMMTKDVACEYAKRNVRVNCINPSFTDTNMVRELTEGEDPTKVAGYVTPMGRVVQVDDIANLVVFLASDESACINGLPVSIDGGGVNFME
ncbi:SDR family NAD(P)-dependent oxidoreductase [Youxingia wuxianensis]|uniref:SDR family oxidoreductase n=1 Tax=Youxingia wuxianensis TaxID=2763678 RepID=A0A926EJW9_9FIRM|nr:SDR family oxidoreductase [Youxingia wuxianensis]MBC8584733.1 SDR family oxidoreductase [Youxingia wuxianensis]